MMIGWIQSIIVPLVIILITWLAGSIIRRILFKRIAAFSENTKTKIDDVIISAVKTPFMIWCLILGIYLALEVSILPENLVDFIGKGLLAMGVFSITMVIAAIASKLIKIYSKNIESVLPITSLTEHITQIVIFIIGILIILNSMGISIAPILATLGVGGLAVALALQDTLSNLFAGFHVIMARQIKVGDYIKMESGEEGYVTDINWRTTKIRMLPNNVVLVPNAKLAQAIVVNYCLPDKELAVLIDVGVHYKSDLRLVEKITCEAAKEVMRNVNGGVSTFDPFIRYHTFGDFSINFTVILRAKEFVDQYLVKHEFVKLLHERFNKEGIIIPYPIRAINHEQENAQVATR